MLGLVEKSNSQTVTRLGEFARCDGLRSQTSCVLTNLTTAIPFKDNEFNAARVDRTLQHIPNPQKAIAEMIRTVCPRGHVVAMEPDWETFIVNSQNRDATRKLLNFWCDNFPSGWVGRYLSRYFQYAGLTDIQVNPETLVITELDLAAQVFDLRQTAHKAQQVGLLNPQETQDWLNELQQLDQSQAFFCSFTGFIVSGKKHNLR